MDPVIVTGETVTQTKVEPQPAAAATEPAKPSVFDKAMALLKPKAEMLEQIKALESQVQVRADAIAQLNTKVTELEATITSQNVKLAEMVKLEAALEKLTTDQKTVETAAIDKVAALGFPSKNLPAATSSDEKTGGTTPDADAILEQLNAIKDPQEQTKFYQDHEKEIKAAALAASVRARRQ